MDLIYFINGIVVLFILFGLGILVYIAYEIIKDKIIKDFTKDVLEYYRELNKSK